jgi:hypothetical protein
LKARVRIDRDDVRRHDISRLHLILPKDPHLLESRCLVAGRKRSWRLATKVHDTGQVLRLSPH